MIRAQGHSPLPSSPGRECNRGKVCLLFELRHRWPAQVSRWRLPTDVAASPSTNTYDLSSHAQTNKHTHMGECFTSWFEISHCPFLSRDAHSAGTFSCSRWSPSVRVSLSTAARAGVMAGESGPASESMKDRRHLFLQKSTQKMHHLFYITILLFPWLLILWDHWGHHHSPFLHSQRR